MRHVKLGLLSFALAAGWTAAHAQDVPVPPEEIKSKFVGKKLFSRSMTNGALADFVMHADGTATVSASPNFNDTGKWWLNDTGYCTKWTRMRQGQEACFRIVRRGSELLILDSDGKVSSQILRTVD